MSGESTSGGLPLSMRDFPKKKIQAFTGFIEAAGGEILSTSNEWEVLRFRGQSGVSVIYKNAVGRLRWCNGATEAWFAYKGHREWKGGQKTARSSKGQTRRRHLYASLVDRDGDGCFFCGKVTSFESFSIEHLVALNCGGPDHISNMAIAHPSCNQMAGHLSVVQKVRLAEKMKSGNDRKGITRLAEIVSGEGV